jgi:hypothetical protein
LGYGDRELIATREENGGDSEGSKKQGDEMNKIWFKSGQKRILTKYLRRIL